MAHFDVMFTNGTNWASRTFEAPDVREAKRIAVQLAREYMELSEPTEDWSKWELRLAVATGDQDADAATKPILVTSFAGIKR